MSIYTREGILEKVAAGEILVGADLRGADLYRADLRCANLSGANLAEAKYNADTTWPEGFDPKAAGALFVEG